MNLCLFAIWVLRSVGTVDRWKKTTEGGGIDGINMQGGSKNNVLREGNNVAIY